MFRKLSVAALLVLASGAQAQKKVATVPFCATPTLEGSGCAINAGGLLLCNGAAVGDGTAVFIRPASFNAPTLVGDHLSPLRSGTCAAAGAGRIGVWEASCSRDIYEPIVVRLTNIAAADPAPTQAQLVAACQAQAVTPATAGTAGALCNAQLSVTENVATKTTVAAKLGSSAWYNYGPAPTYNLVGGYINRAFGAAAGAVTERYCVYWPSYNAVLGQSGGGTNKLAKPIINTVSTTAAVTNAPAGNAGFFDLLATQAGADARNAALFSPVYQETITVNYVKSGPPATGL